MLLAESAATAWIVGTLTTEIAISKIKLIIEATFFHSILKSLCLTWNNFLFNELSWCSKRKKEQARQCHTKALRQQ